VDLKNIERTTSSVQIISQEAVLFVAVVEMKAIYAVLIVIVLITSQGAALFVAVVEMKVIHAVLIAIFLIMADLTLPTIWLEEMCHLSKSVMILVEWIKCVRGVGLRCG
jgi:hypothetical protein